MFGVIAKVVAGVGVIAGVVAGVRVIAGVVAGVGRWMYYYRNVHVMLYTISTRVNRYHAWL